MTRIETKFKSLTSNNKKALITFLTAGYPDLDYTLEAMQEMVENGADMIELGFPFSDPMADGPMIQEASFHSIEQGITINDVFVLVEKFRLKDAQTPIVLMGYYNPVFSYGVEAFVKRAKEVGVDGFIIVDLPFEEGGEFLPFVRDNGLDWIQLITPTTDKERFNNITKQSSGFLYYVSIAGVTGTKKAVEEEVKKNVKLFQEQTETPICVGFGIKSPDDAKAMAKASKGIIVGTALLEIIKKHKIQNLSSTQESLTKLSDFVKSLRQALDGDA